MFLAQPSIAQTPKNHPSHDCDGDGLSDQYELENKLTPDKNKNWVPDECEVPPAQAETYIRDMKLLYHSPPDQQKKNLENLLENKPAELPE